MIARFTSSLMGLLGESVSSADAGGRMEEIREEMLDGMSEPLPEPATQSSSAAKYFVRQAFKRFGTCALI